MSEQKHTPGPWIIDNQEAFILAPKGSNIEYIASLGDPINDFGNAWDDACMTDEVVANARLIAAAPELLAALEAAREFIADGMAMGFVGMPEDENVLEVIENAIRRAKGESC